MSLERNEKPTRKRPSLARRFGGHFMGVLFPPQKSPEEIAVDRENEAIDQRQQAHFHVNLFREIKPLTPENIQTITDMKELFEQRLGERNTIAERFSLFADEDYADHINTLDLGETKKPGSHDEVAKLKMEYHELLEQLVAADLIDDEIPRAKAKPNIHFSVNPKSGFVTATRNRDLFSLADEKRTLSVSKRMTFLMPLSVAETLQVTRQGALIRRDVPKVEAMIDAQDAEAIIPVRTVYYAKNKLHPESKD